MSDASPAGSVSPGPRSASSDTKPAAERADRIRAASSAVPVCSGSSESMTVTGENATRVSPFDARSPQPRRLPLRVAGPALAAAQPSVSPSRRIEQHRRVIHEVDESLRLLLTRDVVNGSDVEVAFDAPTREWSSKRSSPAVDLFLYDIREDRSQRQQGLVRRRDSEGRVLNEQEPSRRMRLSYLVTAWTQRPEDEHRLLSSLLECFLRYESLPSEVLAGSMADADITVSLTVGIPSVEDRHVSDLWSAIGGELHPALDLVAIAPMQAGIVRPPAPPVLERTRLNVRRPEGAEESRQGRARSGSEEAHPPEVVKEVVFAGQPEDDFDAPPPQNDRPRGRTFEVHRIPDQS